MTSNSNINNGTVPSNKPTTTTTTDQTGGPTSDTYTGSTVDYRTYGVPRNDTYVVGHVQAGQHEPQGSDLSAPSSKAASIPSSRGQAASAHRGAYDNRTYADHNEVNKSSDSSNDQRSVNGRDRYSSRDSGFPGSLERKG